MQNRLLKKLSEIAAKELKSTKGVNPQWKDKAELLELAYGAAKIEADFVEWVESVRESKPDNPVPEYLKLVDSRLSESPATAEDDPRIVSVIAKSYSVSGRPASKSDVQKLLDEYSQNEIEQAWEEYTARLDENELKYAVKSFFRDGGARGIIAARKQRELEDANRNQVIEASIQTALGESQKEQTRILQERAEREAQSERIAANKNALFGG
jgi:hypothetical protein